MKIQVENENFERMRNVLESIRISIDGLKRGVPMSESRTDDTLGARVTDLELKMSKLWTALIDKTPTGQDKLSKFGQSFRRRLK